MSKTRTLREIETNRVVKMWEEEDRAIYDCLLAAGSESDRGGGIVRGEPWGERGMVYTSQLPAEPDS